jgi:hypothetical protein
MDIQNPQERILAATIDMLLVKTSSQIRTREIAQKAGVNIAAIHYYFNTKENLINIAIEKMTIHGHDAWVLENINFENNNKTDLVKYIKFLLSSGFQHKSFASTRIINILNSSSVNVNQMKIYSALFNLIKGIDKTSSDRILKTKVSLIYASIINLSCSTIETNEFLKTKLEDENNLDDYISQLIEILF